MAEQATYFFTEHLVGNRGGELSCSSDLVFQHGVQVVVIEGMAFTQEIPWIRRWISLAKATVFTISRLMPVWKLWPNVRENAVIWGGTARKGSRHGSTLCTATWGLDNRDKHFQRDT